MRANHATKALEAVRRGVGGTSGASGTRRAAGRWLPHPHTVAVCGALLAQLWGLGAAGAYAAAADPLPEPVSRAVGRTLGNGRALDGEPAERAGAAGGHGSPASARPVGQPPSPSPGQADAPGLLGQLADPAAGASPATAVPVPGLEDATAPVDDLLQDRIRAGGLPLPGQRAAVPDAFAIASGLLGTTPDQARSTESRASRDNDPSGAPESPGRTGPGPTHPAPSPGEQRGPAAPPPVQEAADRTGRTADGRPAPGGSGGAGPGAAPNRPAASEDLALTGAAAVGATATAAHGTSGTGTAVLAPIAAGLLLTGAAMCKHRGLPRGH
ncbi:hypothetical protein ACGFZP_29820 [Kitasatospora sp. NPDC048239]|uniref:hypothetical protein n=1 Tax=Kitasatospora sp. NPDC048239 TaxID=3364046 RepID=UPI0037155D62